MRTFDLAPLYRSTVGFDRLFSMLDGAVEAAPTYPPYNIERTGENAYRVTLAVAGFGEGDLDIEAKENVLTVRGEKKETKRGAEAARCSIAASRPAPSSAASSLPTTSRSPARSLENGLLHVDLVREIPEAKKPRQIPIGERQGEGRGSRRQGGLTQLQSSS